MAKVEKIIQELGELNEEDRKKVKAAILNFYKNEEEKEVLEEPKSETENLFFQAMLSELEKRGVRSYISFNSFQQTTAFKSWKRSIKDVNRHIDLSFGSMRRLQKLAIIKLGYSLLAQNLLDRKIPISISTLANNTKDIPSVINSQFPGYIECGLGHIILNAMKKRNKK